MSWTFKSTWPLTTFAPSSKVKHPSSPFLFFFSFYFFDCHTWAVVCIWVECSLYTVIGWRNHHANTNDQHDLASMLWPTSPTPFSPSPSSSYFLFLLLLLAKPPPPSAPDAHLNCFLAQQLGALHLDCGWVALSLFHTIDGTCFIIHLAIRLTTMVNLHFTWSICVHCSSFSYGMMSGEKGGENNLLWLAIYEGQITRNGLCYAHV